MRQEELEIDTIIENLKKEPPYQGRLFIGSKFSVKMHFLI